MTPEGTRQLAGWTEPPIRDAERLWSIVDTLVDVAGELNVSAAQVALAWTLGRPAVTSVIIDGRNEQQLIDTLGAANRRLSVEQRERLVKVSALSLLYPYWHQAQTAHDRLSVADLTLLAPHLSA